MRRRPSLRVARQHEGAAIRELCPVTMLGSHIVGVHRLHRYAQRAPTRHAATVSKRSTVEGEARHSIVGKVISIHPFCSCVSYNMDFFDALCSRVLNANTSRHFRSLVTRKSVTVVSLSRAQTHYRSYPQCFSSRFENAVKQKVNCFLSAFVEESRPPSKRSRSIEIGIATPMPTGCIVQVVPVRAATSSVSSKMSPCCHATRPAPPFQKSRTLTIWA